MELKNKRVLVVGLGRSGVASAFFLQEHGAKVIVSDSKSEAQLQGEVSALLDRGISIETGRHGERTFRDQDLIVVSPGVPSDQPQLQHARSLGIPVIGEVELAFRFLQGKVLAITGSNGKTTTTTLVGEILAKSGKKTLVGGNIGTPVISLAGQSTADSMVALEISSFQLESIQQFRPWIAAILNITPDHLDRHHTFQAYVDAKARIFENQQASDFAVLNADDPTCVALKDKIKAALLWFSRKQPVENGAFVKGERYHLPPQWTGADSAHAFRYPAQRRTQSGKRPGRSGNDHGCRMHAAAGTRGGKGISCRGAPAGTGGHHQRRYFL